MEKEIMTGDDFDLIFRKAHTASQWTDAPVSDALLKNIYDMMKFGPTSLNSCPLRIVFVKGAAARDKLRPCLEAGNVDKTMAAPVTAIFASDMRFFDYLPRLFPPIYAKAWFDGNAALTSETALRNGSLQAAYFMIAARAYGLDCGPMSGFSKEKVDAAFFPDGRFKSNFLCNLGYADTSKTHARLPRFEFDEVCTIA